jgi:phosphoglycerol transferase MdoB-like AlkP superfamily enzyme
LGNPFSAFFAILSIGLLYDIATCFYLFAFFALYLFLLPDRIYRSTLHRGFLLTASFLITLGFLYLGAVEYFFFDEFNARFNFVAVDYLIYPHEVFVNIWESYPVAKVLLVALVIALVLFWRLRARLRGLAAASGFRERLAPFVVFTAALLLVYTGVNASTGKYSDNRVANELAQNGIYSFFYAAISNHVDYYHLYLTLDNKDAVRRLRKLVYQPNARFIPDAKNPIARHIDNPGNPKPLNVIVLTEESLGADFVGAYGDTRGLTPNIDRLAKDSLMFTNVYATGTRTVRGLEAISASFPPIPGEAIIKRRHNEGMFNWGTVMRKHGYLPTFIYGGYGTFDNMNYFFSHNGFNVVDRLDIEQPKFANIWGVSDEDLFHQAIKVFDRQYARGEKIFSIVMSTSNHKPFTFPEGIPGIMPSGGGRDMGVKYADYAIGKFFAEIKSKPYFSDSLFVIVGDHGARVYGKQNIPIKSYELPLLIYAPKHFKPRKIDTLMSQIDIAPTVLGLLNISYDSVFFGRDVFQGDANDKFVLLSHNRDVALYQNNIVSELGVRKSSATYRYDKKTNQEDKVAPDQEQIKNAISIYQQGFEFFKLGQYKID